MKETKTGLLVPDHVAEEAAKKSDDIIGTYTIEVGILRETVGGPNQNREHRQVCRVTDSDGNKQVYPMGKEARRYWRKFVSALKAGK